MENKFMFVGDVLVNIQSICFVAENPVGMIMHNKDTVGMTKEMFNELWDVAEELGPDFVRGEFNGEGQSGKVIFNKSLVQIVTKKHGSNYLVWFFDQGFLADKGIYNILQPWGYTLRHRS